MISTIIILLYALVWHHLAQMHLKELMLHVSENVWRTIMASLRHAHIILEISLNVDFYIANYLALVETLTSQSASNAMKKSALKISMKLQDLMLPVNTICNAMEFQTHPQPATWKELKPCLIYLQSDQILITFLNIVQSFNIQ